MTTPNPLQILEICCMIQSEVLASVLRPAPDDDLIRSLKLLTDDCALITEVKQTRLCLKLVCRFWKFAVDRLPHPLILLPDHEVHIPDATRVQFPDNCECTLPKCPLDRPPATKTYRPNKAPMEAFIDISCRSPRDPLDVIKKYPHLRLLSISVDLTDSKKPFSLPFLSRTCSGLTHLSLSEFILPVSKHDQTLSLPRLNTLTLNFFCSGESTSSGLAMVFHPSFHKWSLPQLRNLGLKGWVADSNTAFLQCIHHMIRRVGASLHGLLYNLWYPSDVGDAIHSLPPLLWEWCPHLHTVQTSLRVLFSGPTPIRTRRWLTVVPVLLAALDQLPPAHEMATQLWPRQLFEEVKETNWPIERIRIANSWPAFHRKLLEMYEESNASMDERWPRTESQVRYWPTYFCRWFKLLLWKGYAVEDRYGVPINLPNGPSQELFSWLQDFDLALIDSEGTW